MKRTKIIATLGPASNSPEIIRDLIKSGMDVVRINMSHSLDENAIKTLVNVVRKEAESANRSVSIIFDLAGPKLRVKRFSTDKSILIDKDSNYTIGYLDSDIPIDLDLRFKSIEPGASVKINDGNLSFRVITHNNNQLELVAENSGEITSGKGVNFPSVKLNIPAVTEKDLINLRLAIAMDIDWIAMSFVRNIEDCEPIKKIFEEQSNIFQ